MGIKIILTKLCICLSIYATAQSENIILKKFALNKCIANNYKSVDSSFVSHDYSASYIFQVKNADYKKLNLIEKYVRKTTSDFFKMGTSENLGDAKSNYIFWYCINFYESKELDNFIKRLSDARLKKIVSKK